MSYLSGMVNFGFIFCGTQSKQTNLAFSPFGLFLLSILTYPLFRGFAFFDLFANEVDKKPFGETETDQKGYDV